MMSLLETHHIRKDEELKQLSNRTSWEGLRIPSPTKRHDFVSLAIFDYHQEEFPGLAEWTVVEGGLQRLHINEGLREWLDVGKRV